MWSDYHWHAMSYVLSPSSLHAFQRDTGLPITKHMKTHIMHVMIKRRLATLTPDTPYHSLVKEGWLHPSLQEEEVCLHRIRWHQAWGASAARLLSSTWYPARGRQTEYCTTCHARVPRDAMMRDGVCALCVAGPSYERTFQFKLQQYHNQKRWENFIAHTNAGMSPITHPPCTAARWNT